MKKLLIGFVFAFAVLNLYKIFLAPVYGYENSHNLKVNSEISSYSGAGKNEENKKIKTKASIYEDYAKALEDLIPNVKVEGKSGEEENEDYCKALLYRTLKSLPENHYSTLENLVLTFDQNERRGLGSGSRVKIRCTDVEENELVGIMVHEIGHVADLGHYLGHKKSGASGFKDGRQTIYKDDPSVEFYKISWKNEKTRKSNSKLDFVTTYAMTDTFEDFAETYIFYVLHGEKFRLLKNYNKTLQKKYEFMKTKIFDGQEFGQEAEAEIRIITRNYDSTVMNYDLNTFFTT